MVKKIIWSKKAQKDRLSILTYWNNRNKSKTYSQKLNQLFKESTKLLCRYPNLGIETDVENVRVKIVQDYLIIYESTRDQIIILTIWDSRQNPEKLKYSF